MSHATSESTWRWEEGTGGVRTLWFDQPGASQNVLTSRRSMSWKLAWSRSRKMRSVARLVIRSAKPAGFCAGADLERILSLQTPAEAEAFLRRGLAVLDRLAALRGADARRDSRCLPGWRARAGARVPAARGTGLGGTDPGGNARGPLRLDSGLGGHLANSAHRWP